MTSAVNIYAGANGSAASKAGSLINDAIIDPKLAGNGGTDLGMWGALAGAAWKVGSRIKGGVTENKWYKATREKWNQFRGKGGEVGEVARAGADDAVKGVSNAADDVVKGAAKSADGLAKGAAGAVDDVAKGGAELGTALRAGGKFVAGAARVAGVAAVAVDGGLRAYDSYEIEKRHDNLEEARAKGLLDERTMEKVTEERNAGHTRNWVGFGAGLAGMVAGAKAGAAVGFGAGALVSAPTAGLAAPLTCTIGAGLGTVIGAFLGYAGANKVGEMAADAYTGYDSSYSNTQQAMAAVEAHKFAATTDTQKAGEAWAKARERSTYQSGAEVPGLAAGDAARTQFAVAMGEADVPQPSGGVVVKSSATGPLQRGKSVTVSAEDRRVALSR